MNPEQSSISIISKNNGQVTGESAGALPIKLVSSNLALKFFAIGFMSCVVLTALLVMVIKRQVIVVDTTGVADESVEYKLSE